jgi:hypothetical protein
MCCACRAARSASCASPAAAPSGSRARSSTCGAATTAGRSGWRKRDPEPGVSARASALIDGTKKPARRWAFVLVNTTGTGNLTKANAEAKVFGDRPDSIRSYYREVSYGLQDLDGDVIGPVTIDAASVTGGLCEGFSAVGRALRPMVGTNYDQYLYYFESPIRNCPWGGVAILGTAAKPTADSYYNAAAQCVVLVQEPGHNFGMVHSSALRCSKGGTPVSMIDPLDNQSSCQHDEYGNPFDPMGGGNPGGSQMLNNCYHMNGVQKAYQDWLEGCNIVKATTSGTFTIYPLETACNGTQLLQIPLLEARGISLPPTQVSTTTRAQLTAYYLELRTPVGLDRGLVRPRVFVLAAGNLKEARLRGNNNWLIDTTPETRTVADADLAVGKTFTDPLKNGPKFTVVSADATKAVIRVQLNGEAATDTPGNGVCSDDTPFTGPGPSTCQALAGTPPGGGSGGAGGSGGSVGEGGAGGGAGGSGTGGSGGMIMNPDDSPDAGSDEDAEPEEVDAGHPSPVAVSACHCHVGNAPAGGGSALFSLVLGLLVTSRHLRRRRP